VVELFITFLARIHRFLSFRVYYRKVENGNVRFHSLDGKWMGGAQLSSGTWDNELKDIVPYPEGPQWKAFVICGGEQTGFSNLEDTEVVTRQLLRQHRGPYLITERKFGT
jgi:hypothetical protein